MPSKIEVKKVIEQTELDKASAIRYEVFVIGQDCPPELEAEFDEESTHFLATVNGEPAGACRFRKTEKGYKLERFAVLQKFRGLGIGQTLVTAALEALPADADYIYLHAQVQAVSLYTRFGFVQSGSEFEEAGMRHYKMVKK
ncbi:GNAT family N-acetyltransferase [Mucilaginibacter sp. OK283]|jgi:predicted GNAT family N-acyltransferase|uniref:GNAT family N-acetyltransferase n=1 Tax=Mucilaginibacter sp. OK283 TaxID=1881049 RepID=UPI0008BBBCD2|nr:GNAT family N-acetyltransferase [Mucilaginibacter sp. OK283]SEP08517.1 Predicted N-acyltransferase, GNAT family [Mucilaginibacter sp. OK283]